MPVRDHTHALRVIDRHVVAHNQDVVALTLASADGKALPRWFPGAHIDIHLPSGRVRQYSLCNSPDARYRIAVKPEPNGRGGSLEAHAALQVGTVVTVSTPRNNFELIGADRYVLVAGGIGITPLLSMAHHLWAHGTPFTLHVCAQDAAAVPFRDELLGMPFASAVRIHPDAAPGRSSMVPAEHLGPPTPGAALSATSPAFPFAARNGVTLSPWRATEERLRQAGMQIDSVKGKDAVGRIPIEKLAALAEIAEVVYVFPKI